MKKEWFLLIGVVTVTLVIALGLIRWFAPQLLGIPVDLQAVRVSKKIPPFFENVFRKEDIESRTDHLKDPYVNIRGRPMLVDFTRLGPHDLLGFRNMNIPSIADVVAIGDSQTYGNNVVLTENWPSQTESLLKDKRPVVYSMATGGWGAVQYLNMFTHATFFRPRVIVVAFYSGNDPDESTNLAYSVDRWAALRPDPDLDLSDKPRYPGFPVPAAEQWQANFKSGQTIIFTPSLRLVSNDTAHATVRAGYQIMEKVAQLIASSANEANIHIVLTIIPTKELVYAERIRREGINASADYRKLVELERKNIEQLSQSFKLLPNTEYVDLVEPLQQAALFHPGLYPSGINGHPLEAGYRLIATALAPVIGKYLKEPPSGLLQVVSDKKIPVYFLVTEEGLWQYATDRVVKSNGWNPAQARTVDARDIAVFPQLGMIDSGDPKQFGPRAVRQRNVAH